ncbi:hypothetical protein GWC77_24805 [Paraburkholderia sp. NMBU_R16]|uniref:hypothetical protein n=1 Tax=Paraburkholderia sp. NMBU_R16 TaxID=2698676 RepID=UPI00156645E5|nr:hypothetical protein [Paraburkholderia sp. NMBU_R16]NRO99123.1 hypothetical protein [Paraburkholderia sp. NMBU_R16]
MTDTSLRPVRAVVLTAMTAVSLFTVKPLFAQADTPVRVSGSVATFHGDTLSVRDRDGRELAVRLQKDTPIRGVTLANIADVKPGSYVGTAAIAQADGTLKALEVHIFAPSMRGAGEGYRPWDLAPSSSMTNGTVGSLVVGNGRTMVVKYSTGEKTVIVPPDVPIVYLEPGNRSLLVSGAHVLLFAHKDAQGALIANFVSAGENGVVPPM